MIGQFTDMIRGILPEERIREREPMKLHTTFKCGGEADLLLEICSRQELKASLEVIRSHRLPYFILGNGSNLLVSDQGFRGVVLHLSGDFERIEVSGTRITAGAAAMLGRVAHAACESGLTGLEFASGIPGSLGGGALMNAGAYGGELSQVITFVACITKEGEELRLPVSDLEYGYRTSRMKKEQMLITEVEFELKAADPKVIGALMNELNAKRREKQPLEYPSAGSTFKRPEGYFAGKLIQDAGLRGYCVGGAQVSEKHCGFVVNKGDATASDVWQLMKDVRKEVEKQFAVTLEPEVILVGEFEE